MQLDAAQSDKAALDHLSEQVQTLAVDLASFTNVSGTARGASEALTLLSPPSTDPRSTGEDS